MVAVTDTPMPGGAVAGGFSAVATVQVSAGGAIAGGIPPTAIVWSALLTPLADALQQLDQLGVFHAHPLPDHHDKVAMYTDATVALMAFVIAVSMVLRRAL